jgi:hypothetical protein
MRISFRKSFKLGPFRTTISNRGITNSVGGGGFRAELPGYRRRKSTGLSRPSSFFTKCLWVIFIIVLFSFFGRFL